MTERTDTDASLEDALGRQLQASVATMTPSRRLRAAVLDGSLRPGPGPGPGPGPRARSRGRRTRSVVVATIAVAAIGIGTAAASGLFDRPDPQDAAAVEGLHAGEYSSHGPGWRPELMAETFICSWAPGENLHTFASSGPLAARFEAETVTAACLDNMTDSVRGRGDTTTPVLSGEPRICATTSGVYDFDPSLTNVGPFLAVVLDDRSCAAAGFSDTDVPGLLAIVNDRRAREVRFLARFNTGTCIAADEALTIAREHSSDLGADFTVRANPRGDQICFRPQVSWERHEAVLYPSRERPGSQGRD